MPSNSYRQGVAGAVGLGLAGGDFVLAGLLVGLGAVGLVLGESDGEEGPGLAVGVELSEAAGLGVVLALGVGDGLALWLGVAVGVGDDDGVRAGRTLAVGVGHAVALGVPVGSEDVCRALDPWPSVLPVPPLPDCPLPLPVAAEPPADGWVIAGRETAAQAPKTTMNAATAIAATGRCHPLNRRGTLPPRPSCTVPGRRRPNANLPAVSRSGL